MRGCQREAGDTDKRVAGSLLAGSPVSPIRAVAAAGSRVSLLAPSGRFFSGTTVDAWMYPAVAGSRILATVPPGHLDDPLLRTARRVLMVGVTDDGDAPGLFGMDARLARCRLTGGSKKARLVIPQAYALDDVTSGIVWAVANMDEALLADDAALDGCRRQATGYTHLPRSAVSRDIADGLDTVSQMWLGSAFCAGHILRHARDFGDAPVFWTREQRGEEASAWLLFAHKYAYLAALAGRDPRTESSRVLCVPPDTVTSSPGPERILLLLAVALMESFGIHVEVCPDLDYAAVGGFVLDPRRRAVVANWVDADGIWHVDITDNRTAMREYADACGYARAHSVISASASAPRLHALADYLDLDWPWMVQRCAELGEYGCTGLVAPHSRLLSLAGVDRACRYLGALDRSATRTSAT
ncbi:hypothetical protein [Frankia sp. Cr1]|uniref:hypothetical protein n=1 Tax=Frankia sp. Cr1 TaxID=3073931 RepID=UPI002AD3F489|nr:hypothetical protein [Frankia sp. Cr1]